MNWTKTAGLAQHHSVYFQEPKHNLSLYRFFYNFEYIQILYCLQPTPKLTQIIYYTACAIYIYILKLYDMNFYICFESMGRNLIYPQLLSCGCPKRNFMEIQYQSPSHLLLLLLLSIYSFSRTAICFSTSHIVCFVWPNGNNNKKKKQRHVVNY